MNQELLSHFDLVAGDAVDVCDGEAVAVGDADAEGERRATGVGVGVAFFFRFCGFGVGVGFGPAKSFLILSSRYSSCVARACAETASATTSEIASKKPNLIFIPPSYAAANSCSTA